MANHKNFDKFAVCRSLASRRFNFAIDKNTIAKSYFKRYVWLLDTIMQHGHITLTDLNDLWRRSALNENGDSLPPRTFHNHREAILESSTLRDRIILENIPSSQDYLRAIINAMKEGKMLEMEYQNFKDTQVYNLVVAYSIKL